MTLIHLHPNPASLEYHMVVAGPLPPPFADLLEHQSIDVFGEPSNVVLEQLRWKAELLGSGSVRVHASLAASTAGL